jgi:twitching motility protein PilT
MEKLNEYLSSLLSSCSDELRLEPNKNPYLVSDNRTTDVAQVPLQGPQISAIVFPLIPARVISELPNREEIEFVHPHQLGNFNFNVQKSPAGFNVTIRPMLADPSMRISPPLPPEPPAMNVGYTGERPSPFVPETVNFESAAFAELENGFEAVETYEPAQEYSPAPVEEAVASEAVASYELESVSSAYDMTTSFGAETASVSDLVVEEKAPQTPEYFPGASEAPGIEVVSVNDPEYQTVFSDTAADEPLDKYDLAAAAFAPPVTPSFEPSSYDMSPMEAAPIPMPVMEPAMPPPAIEKPPLAYIPPQERPAATFVPAAANAQMANQMDTLFCKMADLGASDLHLSVSMPPLVRMDGKMKPLEEGGVALTAEAMRSLLTSIMPSRNQEEFAEKSDTDFAYEIPGLARFRCNVFADRKGMGAVFRIIPSKILTAEQLGLSKAIMDLCGLSKGLVVVTGPTGSGKSTTLCAMVDAINKEREDHIITIEDPIEFVHENQKCLVNQREVHNHTDSFKNALRAALREDPDIVLVGEMRDLETISIAIETAETGHLVFGTLHTTTAASTVDRIIDQFPADRQQQIRVMLSESLKGVIAQTLLPKKGGGRVAALEVLIVTPAISNLIREGKTFQIPSAMQTGKNLGMVMLNDALFEHVQAGRVEAKDAYMKAVDKAGFETQLTRGGFKL